MKPDIGREISSPEVPYEEYELRINKARELMGKHKIDAMLLFSPLHMRYYLGFRKASYGSSEQWRRLAIIPRDKDSVFIPANIVHRLAMKTTWVKDIRAWADRIISDFLSITVPFSSMPSKNWGWIIRR